MRLPRQEQSSRSMSSTMRRAVTEKNRVASRASIQKFTPMPTNYNQVGTAQANAALSNIKVWDSVGKLGLQIKKLDYEQQRAAMAAKKARLMEWAAAYNTEVAMSDLTEKVEGTLTPKHSRVNSDFKSRLASKMKELDKEFNITDSTLKEEFSNIKIGIVSETSNYIARLADSAKDEEAKNNAEVGLNSIRTKDEFRIWDQEHGSKWWTPLQREQFKRSKFNDIEAKGIRARLASDPAFDSNVHIRDYAESEKMRLANDDEFFPEAYDVIIKELEVRRQQNIDRSTKELYNAMENPEFQINAHVLAEMNLLKKEYREDKIGREDFTSQMKILESQLAETLLNSKLANFRKAQNTNSAAEIDAADDDLLRRLNLPYDAVNKITDAEFESLKAQNAQRRNELLHESKFSSSEFIESLDTNKEVDRYRREQKEKLDNKEISPEEYADNMNLADKKQVQNYNDTLDDLNSTDGSLIHMLLEMKYEEGNVSNYNQQLKAANASSSQFYFKESSERVNKAVELFEDGSEDQAFEMLAEAYRKLPEDFMSPIDYENAKSSIQAKASAMITDSLRDFSDKGALFTTELVEENGELVNSETTRNSPAAIFLAETRRRMIENPELYGLEGGINLMAGVAGQMQMMRGVIEEFSLIEKNATAERQVYSEKLLLTNIGTNDPGALAAKDFTNYNEDIKRSVLQDSFEGYVERRQKETEADYGDPFNPGNLKDRTPNVHNYALEFTYASGYAPPGYVEQLSSILNNPNTENGIAAGAAKNLIEILSVNPGATDQEGLEQEGFVTAINMAHYIRESGSPDGGAEFLAARRQEALDPTGFAKKVKALRESSKPGGAVADMYATMVAQNPWMPTELDDRIYDHIATIIGEQFNLYKSEPAAIHKSIRIALRQWAPETSYKLNSDGEVTPVKVWKFNSIYRLSAHADPAVPHDEGQLTSGTIVGASKWFSWESDRNNVVNQIIEDVARFNGLDPYGPDGVTTMWVGGASLNPKYRDDPRFNKGGWVLTDHEGVQLYDVNTFQKTGHKIPIFIGIDYISPRAAVNKDIRDVTERYESAKGSYEEWQKYMNISEDSATHWAVRMVDGAARWFESNDKQRWDAVEALQETQQELDTIKLWEDKAGNADEGSIEEASARQVIELLRSNPYRASYLDSELLPEDRKSFQELMINNAISISEAFYREREAKRELERSYPLVNGVRTGLPTVGDIN